MGHTWERKGASWWECTAADGDVWRVALAPMKGISSSSHILVVDLLRDRHPWMMTEVALQVPLNDNPGYRYVSVQELCDFADADGVGWHAAESARFRAVLDPSERARKRDLAWQLWRNGEPVGTDGKPRRGGTYDLLYTAQQAKLRVATLAPWVGPRTSQPCPGCGWTPGVNVYREKGKVCPACADRLNRVVEVDAYIAAAREHGRAEGRSLLLGLADGTVSMGSFEQAERQRR